MAEYPGASRAAVSPNRSPRQGRVQLFIVHHYAGMQDPESAWRRFNAANDRSVSPNYQVNADGSVFEVVPPDRFRAWTTGAIDHQAVTCETQNASGAPAWAITQASHEAIAHLIAWASRRYGFPIQRGAVADGNRVTRPGVVGHRETPAGRETSTACPGPSMNLDWLVARAQEIASGSPAGGGANPYNPEDDVLNEADKEWMRLMVQQERDSASGRLANIATDASNTYVRVRGFDPGADMLQLILTAANTAAAEDGSPTVPFTAADLARELAPLIDVTASELTDAELDRIAQRLADEQARRLAE